MIKGNFKTKEAGPQLSIIQFTTRILVFSNEILSLLIIFSDNKSPLLLCQKRLSVADTSSFAIIFVVANNIRNRHK